jgi:hypothetical protein
MGKSLYCVGTTIHLANNMNTQLFYHIDTGGHKSSIAHRIKIEINIMIIKRPACYFWRFDHMPQAVDHPAG